jgi:alkylation response protein AidB-like acyl-CoA dehydrogenase
MDFDFTDLQASWRTKGEALGRDVTGDAPSVIAAAARAGLLDPAIDLLALAGAVEAMAHHRSPAAVVFALHSAVALAMAGDDRFAALFRGETVAGVGLSSDEMPVEREGRLSGRAPWIAPITDRGLVVVGPRSDGERAACAVALDARGVTIEGVETAALSGLACGHVAFDDAPCVRVGPTLPIMIRIRILMAAAGLGMGRRALQEALVAAKAAHTVAAGEQTAQGLLADAATDLDAAMLMTWKAASAVMPSLADASLAKLMATSAAQRAVERATQVIGADSFRAGHVIERLAQDVRALELFAGRTEALRAAAAEEILPGAGAS